MAVSVPTKVVSAFEGDDGDTSKMARRNLRALLLLISSFAAAAYFVIFPLWQIEHPTDSSLVLRGERHLLWQAPTHAHLDAAAIAIPVLAIAIVATALIIVVLHSGE